VGVPSSLALYLETLERAMKAGMVFGSGDACTPALSVDAEARRIAGSIIAGLANAA
jgi:1-deoxy-D-xylulose-5-phosphate reductoisomerase